MLTEFLVNNFFQPLFLKKNVIVQYLRNLRGNK